MAFKPRVNAPLEALEDSAGRSVFVGRSQSLHRKYGREGALLLGKVAEEEKFGEFVYLDALTPHTIFVCGAKGSGKCLLPDEPVILADGSIKSIKEVFEELAEESEPVIQNKGEEFLKVKQGPQVVSLDKDLKQIHSQISHVYRKKVKEDMVQVKTRSGKRLIITKEHPLLHIDNGVKWINGENLRKGQRIAVPRTLHVAPSAEDFEFPEYGDCVSGSKSQHEAMFLMELVSGPRKVSNLKTAVGNKCWEVAHGLEDEGLISLQCNSPLTATLTSEGMQRVEEFETGFVRLSSRSMPVKLPSLNKELGRFMGYLVAEGTEVLKENKFRIMFTNKEKEKTEDFDALSRKLFGLPTSQNNLSRYVDSWALKLFFDEIGYSAGQKSRQKDIPNFIMSAPDEVAREFIRAFVDCECHVSKSVPQIEVMTASKQIASKLAYLLLRFGIFSQVKEKTKYAANTVDRTRRQYYAVSVYGSDNLRVFSDEIGLLAERKRKALAAHLTKSSNPNFDVVPNMGKTIKKTRELLGLRQEDVRPKSHQKYHEDGKHFPSRKTFAGTMDRFRDRLEEIEKSHAELEKTNESAAINNLRQLIGLQWKEVMRELGLNYRGKEALRLTTVENKEKIREIVLRTAEERINSVELQENLALLDPLTSSDVHWDEVIEVKKIPYEGFVYDLTVEGTHNFIAGANGGIVSHNSYTLGILAEELIYKNPNVAVVIIDPIGIYWSMKYPNQEEAELDDLVRMGLAPRGVDGVRVFVPEGVRDTLPRDTYDKLYALRPADLTVDDWCLTFDIDRFSPTGLLLEKCLEKVFNGYKTTEKKSINPNPDYGIPEIVNCLNNDVELVSKSKGFKTDSRRALTSRFESAKSWGIFSANGTPLVDLCVEGKVSVIDVSFLDEKVTSLVIGLLARKILNARKLSARKTAMKRLAVSMDEVLETGIPPTWLFIDEAHTLIPSGSAKTAASDALIEYVKQGRRPGCSLAMATQQPAALDTKILSQLDLLICHKLTFDDDIKSVFKRMPAAIPKEYSSRFIKTIPIGHCLIGDRSDHTSRVFAASLRPRFSQHEGRETRSVEFEETLSAEQVENLLVKMVRKQLEDFSRVNLSKVDQLVRTINKRYGTKISAKNVVNALASEAVVDSEQLVLKEVFEQDLIAEEEMPMTESVPETSTDENLLVFKPDLEEPRAKVLALKHRKKKLLGLFGDEETLKDFKIQYWPIYKVEYDYYKGKGFKRSVCFVDGMTGELLSVGKKGIAATRGVGKLVAMNKSKRQIIQALRKGKQATAKGIAGVAGVTETTARSNAEELVEEGILSRNDRDRAKIYVLKEQFDLPPQINIANYTTLESNFTMDETRGFVPTVRVTQESVEDVPALFGEVKIRNISFIYRPVYHASFASTKGPRDVYIDGMDGAVVK